MVRINGFEELSEELERIANSFHQMIERHGKDTAYTAIERGIDRAMDETVIPEAKRRVPKDTGRLAESVDHEQRGWRGDRYHHAYGSTLDEEYARVQEFGTQRKNYLITPNGDYPLSFVWENPPPGAPFAPGSRVAFEYVVHPGVDVPQPGPMQSALKDNVNVIRGHVGNEVAQMVKRNLDE